MEGCIEEIVNAFPKPNSVVETTGIQAGIILKYHRYYLKIYYRLASDYKILGYLYNQNQPLFVHHVEDAHLRDYGAAFTPNAIPVWFPYATLGTE